MAQALLVRLPDGRMVRPEDWTSAPLYSTVEIATGALTTLEAFSFGQNGEVPGSVGPRRANASDTNLKGQGGIIPEDEELLIYGICISLFQVTAASTTLYFTGNETFTPDPPHVTLTNVLRVQKSTVCSLRIAATKEYIKMPLGFFPASTGVNPVLGSDRSQGSGYTQTELIGSNGGVSEGTHRKLATPQQVAPGEAFTINFDFPSGQVNDLDFGDDTAARILARVSTRGVRKRPVA